MKWILLIGSLLYVIAKISGQEDEYVKIIDIPGLGKVKGDVRLNSNGEKFLRYFDIPYAFITEKGWFQPAIPIPPEDGIVNEETGSICPELNSYFFESEAEYRKCLVLKIDGKDPTGKLPVIVFIPGYNLGSESTATTYGSNIMTKDAVMVTPQYRLGAFGFLSTQTDEIPGNVGILDIIDALKWIQKYIKYFGGDPDRVTISGQYLAAGMVGVLTASPLTDGLFHRVILQNGSPEMEHLKTENPLIVAKEVGAVLNCTNVDDVGQLNQCLIDASIHPETTLLRAYYIVWKNREGKVYPITIGGPSGVINKDYKYRKYPMIGGFVDSPIMRILEETRKSEYSIFSTRYYAEKYKDKLEELSKPLKDIHHSKTVIDFLGTDAVFDKLTTSYISLPALIESQVPIEIDLKSLDIKLSILKTLKNNRKLGGSSYLYIFRFSGIPFPYKSTFTILKNYVDLLGDMQLLYTYDGYEGDLKEKSNFMVHAWVSFAATGIPNISDVFKWPQIASDLGPYLVIDKIDSIRYNITKELMPMTTCTKTKTCG